MLDKLRTNPKTASYMNDPSFVRGLQEIGQNQQALSKYVNIQYRLFNNTCTLAIKELCHRFVCVVSKGSMIIPADVLFYYFQLHRLHMFIVKCAPQKSILK